MSLDFCRAGEIKKGEEAKWGGHPQWTKVPCVSLLSRQWLETRMYLTLEGLCIPKSLVSILSTTKTNISDLNRAEGGLRK